MSRKRDSVQAELDYWAKQEPEEADEAENGAVGVTDVAELGSEAAWDGDMKTADVDEPQTPPSTPPPWKDKEPWGKDTWSQAESKHGGDQYGQWKWQNEHAWQVKQEWRQQGWKEAKGYSQSSGGHYVSNGWIDGQGTWHATLALEQ